MSDCRRTPRLVDRLVDGRVTSEDVAHAAVCGRCGPILTRAQGFDDELRRSARSLVVEDLPWRVLELPVEGAAGLGVLSRRGAPGLATVMAAMAIVLTAAAIALSPAAAPPPAPSPTAPHQPTKAPFAERFRSTDVLRGQLAKLGYSCNDGLPLSSVGPEPDAVTREATVCTAPESIGPFVMAVIVGEAANGEVVELTIKSDIVGAEGGVQRGAIATAVAKVFALSLLDEGAGQSGGLWVKTHLVELERGEDVAAILRQVSFRASRMATGSYVVAVRGAAAAP